MKPAQSYLICGVQQSGSIQLSDALKSTQIAGVPDEHFLEWEEVGWTQQGRISSRQSFLDLVLKNGCTPNGVFGSLVMWNYFGDCLNKTSSTFINNQGLFGKVYFPRFIIPLGIVITNLLKFGIQMLLFAGFWLYYYFKGYAVSVDITLVLFPWLVVIMAFLGLGFGMLISAMTTKYRDLKFLVEFGVRLLMYATPVVYPLSIVPEKYQTILLLNPMTTVIEAFKFSCLGKGYLSWTWLGYSTIFSIVILIFGLLVFNKVEKSFIDTV